MAVNIVGLVLFLFIIVGLTVMFVRYRKGASGSEEEPLTMQDLLGLESIRNGMITLKDGRHCRIIAVGSINYSMESEEDAERIDAIFGSMLASLNFPTQFYTQTRLLDLSNVVVDLEADIKRTPFEKLQYYGIELKRCLQDWINIRSVMLRRSYVVVICDTQNYSRARQELDLRQQTVIEGLSRIGLATKPLNDREIADLYYAIYNTKTRALVAPLRGAVNDSLYVENRDWAEKRQKEQKKGVVGLEFNELAEKKETATFRR